ncbi:ABC transporter permease [Candidatus Latescibacterota bacterium]
MKRIRVFHMREFGILLGFLFLCIVLSIMSDRFLTLSNLTIILRQTSINAILAAGMTFVIISAGIDLSVGSIVALTGVIAASIAVKGYGIVAAVMGGLAVSVVIGAFNGYIIGKHTIPPFICTLSTMIIVRGLALVYTKGYPVFGLPSGYKFIGSGFLLSVPIPVIIMAIVYMITSFVLKHTNMGFYTFAIGGNEEATRLSGVNVVWYKIKIYTLNGLLAGVAGIVLTSRLNTGQPTAGEMFELDAIAAVVLGGTKLSGGEGTLLGTLIGAFIIGIIGNGLNLLDVPSFYQYLVKGGIILLAVLLDTLRRKEKLSN